MPERIGLFLHPNHRRPLARRAGRASPPQAATRTQFEVLVRHSFIRFFHNELIASDDETKRVMLVAYAVALPGLLVALFLYPAYHGFPPNPLTAPSGRRPATTTSTSCTPSSSWEPQRSTSGTFSSPISSTSSSSPILPIAKRRLFSPASSLSPSSSRLVLLGTNAARHALLPDDRRSSPTSAATSSPTPPQSLMSGTFAAATFLALQGILLNTVGEHIFRRITPLLQGASAHASARHPAPLPDDLALAPAAAHLQQPQPSVTFRPSGFSGSTSASSPDPPPCPSSTRSPATAARGPPRCSPARCSPIRSPIAAGSASSSRAPAVAPSDKPQSGPIHRLLHATILRLPAQRAIFHFISQTILRASASASCSPCTAASAIALAVSNMLVLRSRSWPRPSRLTARRHPLRRPDHGLLDHRRPQLRLRCADRPPRRHGSFTHSSAARAPTISPAPASGSPYGLCRSAWEQLSSCIRSPHPACGPSPPSWINSSSPSASPSCSPTSSS